MSDAAKMIEQVVRGAEPRTLLREAGPEVELGDYLDDLYKDGDEVIERLYHRYRNYAAELQRELHDSKGHDIVRLASEIHKGLETVRKAIAASITAVEKYQPGLGGGR